MKFDKTPLLDSHVLCYRVDSFTKLETAQRQFSSNYTGGEKAGQNWTDKVMGFKQQSADPGPSATGEGGEEVEEDEWVGVAMIILTQYYCQMICFHRMTSPAALSFLYSCSLLHFTFLAPH